MKLQKNPITPSAREAFVLYVREWQERLNLSDWRIHVDNTPAENSNMAEVVRMDYESRLAVIRIGADFGSVTVDDESLEKIACHEVFHVFLHSLLECAGDGNCPDDVIASEEHRVIHVLVNLLVGKGH